MSTPITILGIESSCDDTAAAVVRGEMRNAEILSNVVFGQTEIHASFGGVVPEIAARAHAEKIDFVVEQALEAANTNLTDIDAIAVTAGPGLIGGVLSGVMCAKGLSVASGVPLMGINHLAGHALTPQLTDGIEFPYLMLLVSGGHCQFLLVEGHDTYTRLGGTIDDAPGEAFDKTARILGLPQPGGPSVEVAAQAGNSKTFSLPRPLLNRDDCNMSFSGLKTAILRARDDVISQHGGLPTQARADLCAGFQAAVTDVLVAKSRKALAAARALAPSIKTIAVAGGVAANGQIRAALKQFCAEENTEFVAPPLSLCTDNAAMIAYAGLLRFTDGMTDDLTLSARPRWPLDQKSASLTGSGKKGAKS
ncbi:MAG TPA: tRNA (adenosine(37)-N6)-threonylcarbamoyltransferase complex transferase subunit TsaD [Octadecabacter sp.]|nr:tRNA (adenosine(37)-N6)-threonylcarbamoyltransferase complex transferase subunit TsaD [Octadecabacter sp.]